MKQILLMIAAVAVVGCGSASSAGSAQKIKMGKDAPELLAQVLKGGDVVHGRREVDCQLIGTYPYYPEFTQSKIIAGQFLSEAEENSKAFACVISLELAQRLFAGHNPLMEKVVVRGYESAQVFQVKGILEERVDTEKLPQLPGGTGHSIAANMYIP